MVPGNSLELVPVVPDGDRMAHEEQQGGKGQEIDPQAPPREEGLLHLQTDDRQDLCAPEPYHLVASSPPMRYS